MNQLKETTNMAPRFTGRSAHLLLALICLVGAKTIAQETPAALLVELEQALPKQANPQGGMAPLSSTIDWDKVIDKVGSILARGAGTPAEPRALFVLGSSFFSADRHEEALSTFEDLKKRFPSHPLVKTPFDPETKKSLVDQAIDDCMDEVAFRRKNDIKNLARPILDKALTATIHFSSGDVKVQFYTEAAPKHRENFLKLAREGFYDRTRVHKVMPGSQVHLGDPKSKEVNPAEWGKGDPGYALDNEFSLASHRRGTISMFRGPGKPKSHGSQFQVLLADMPHLDFVQTAFAEVVEGLEILERVSKQTRNQYDAPVEDCFINGISISTSK